MTQVNRIFSPAQRELLTAVLNRLIPEHENRPAAGDLGTGEFVESVAANAPVLTRMFIEGLTAIEIVAGGRDPGGFAALADEEKDGVLRAVETRRPDFFGELVNQTYNGYYTNDTVYDSIGYNILLPPEPGAQPDLLDVALLETQRQRPPFWTKV